MFKNRCAHADGKPIPIRESGKQGDGCGLGDMEENKFGVKCGICPSLARLLENRAATLRNDKGTLNTDCGDLGELWTQAQLGHPLNGRELQSFLKLLGDLSEAKPDLQKAEFARVVDSWCESSAVAAAARTFASARAVAADVVVLSNQLADHEKAQFLGLAERYKEIFALAQMDANARLAATATITGVSIFADRGDAASMATAQATSNQASVSNSAAGGSATFGGQ